MLKVPWYESVYAVLDETVKTNPILLGTAFSIGKGAFATAGHVVEALKPSKAPTLRKLEDDSTVRPISITKCKATDLVDFGIIQAEYEPSSILSWLDAWIPEPKDIYCLGFAYGLHLERRKMSLRHFKGHVVSCQRYHSWEEMDFTKSGSPAFPFMMYELSFACPKCLSGSPLLAELPDNTQSVVGVVIGNIESKMRVFSSKEVIESGEKEETHTVYESLCLGQAVSTKSLLDVKSIVLGNLNEPAVDKDKRNTVREHLGENARKVFSDGKQVDVIPG